MSIVSSSNAMYDGEFPIERSLRFSAASSPQLFRQISALSDGRKFTISMWVKRGTLNSNQAIFSTGLSGSSGDFAIGFGSSLGGGGTGDSLVWSFPGVGNFTSTQVFRDTASWYHVVASIDTTLATPNNRLIIYVNNVAFSLGGSIPQNHVFNIGNISTYMYFGSYAGTNYFDGYFAELHYIEAQSLTPSAFGKFHPVTGQWVAKKYGGTYGSQGFYLQFKNGTSAHWSSLGLDTSGNGNHLSLNNFTRASGVNECWMKDVPASNGNTGIQSSSNYAVLNNITPVKTSITGANLRSGTGDTWANSTLAMTSGKWYAEYTITTLAVVQWVGVGRNQPVAAQYNGGLSADYGYGNDGKKYNAGSAVAYGSTYTSGDVIGVAYDADDATLTFYKNGVSQGTAYSSIPAGEYYFQCYGRSTGGSSVVDANFGQRSFAYTPPTGFKALCTANLPVPIIEKGSRHFDILSYTGDGNLTRSFSNFEFSPDLVWIKNRGGVSHCLWNSIVGGGTNTALATDRTVSEAGHNADATNGYLTTFDSTGFSVQRGSTGAYTNNNATNYVAWLWNASDTERVYNNKGSIPSYVKSNVRAGFSVVTYTGSGAIGTIGHGLSSPPKLIITKNRGASSGWLIYQSDIGTGFYLTFTSAAKTADTAIWQNMQPTQNSFSVGTSVSQLNNEYIAYCFSEVYGYSKIGSYTGNGSADGTFVYCGFRPKYILVKRTDAAAEWKIMDASRSTSNVVDDIIYPDLANAEGVNDANHSYDFVSNGFKVRTSHANTNALNGSYVFYAIAETPFQYSNAR